MSKVSIIIPCYNAEKWVATAVESCLNQTHRDVEIVVVDDGSTDNSRAVLAQFGDKIIFKSIANQGPMKARNVAFDLSSGAYIQYLDADDYLLPTKLADQLRHFEQTGADVVYSDWRHLVNSPDGRAEFDDIHIAGEQPDHLESLLNWWWVPPNAYLFRRAAVSKIGGWDEAMIPAADDRDFVVRVAISGAQFSYLPGCYAIYRRHDAPTLSTSNPARYISSHTQVLQKVERLLAADGRLVPPYTHALAKSYYQLAHISYDFDKPKYRAFLQKMATLDPTFTPEKGGLHRWLAKTFGIAVAEQVAGTKRLITRRLQRPVRHR